LAASFAVDAIRKAGRSRLVARAFQIAVDEVAREQNAARVACDADSAAELGVEDLEARTIRDDRRFAADVAALDPTLVTDQSL
jgi:hypothetical protein